MVTDFPYLADLNEKQKEAVLHTGSPLLILAGAGTGKTRVITVKIAYFLEKYKAPPWSILAVTFTNKAAKEMKERVIKMVPAGQDVMIRTFHAFCAWLLRVYGQPLGLNPDFSIYDDEDSLSLLKQLFPTLEKTELRKYFTWISRAKDFALSSNDDLKVISEDEWLPKIYKKYQNRLDEIGNLDFGDLILKSIQLLSSFPEVKERIQHRFRVILVDEYQDSNVAQYELLKQLYSDGCYFCVVGDDDQSIYRFRGAEVQNILSFQSYFPDSHLIRLEQNYRSTTTILTAASEVVSHNSGRLGKSLWSEKESGEKIDLYQLNDQEEEAVLAVSLVDKTAPEKTAVLFRTNAQSLHFEMALSEAGIPYRVVGALRFYSREEVKDALALLAFLANPKDEVAFLRIINKPARGIGLKSQDQILQFANEFEKDKKGNLLEGAISFSQNAKNKAAEGIKKFIDLFTKAKEMLLDSPLSAVLKFFIDASGLTAYYSEEDLRQRTQKVNNLNELVNLATRFGGGQEGLVEFLQQIELDNTLSLKNVSEADDKGVILITMHNTKGLEFDQVIVTGMEEGVFPSARSAMDSDEIEEERRICYVAMTRAREKLVFTCCHSRRLWGQTQFFTPSRFLKEIPKHLMESHSTVNSSRYYNLGKPVSSSEEKKSTFKPTVRLIKAGSASLAKEEEKGFQSEWKGGQGVFHDEYGQGVVVKQWFNGTQEIVLVRFSNGAVKQFIPKYSSLEKIALD